MTNEVILLVTATAVAAGYALRARFGTVPISVSIIVGLVGAAAQGFLLGWPTGLVSAGVFVALTTFLIFTRLLTRTNTFALPALIAFIPFAQGWALIPGLLLAAVLSVATYLRSNSLDDMKNLTTQTAILGMTNQMGEIADLTADIEGRKTRSMNLFAPLTVGLAVSTLLLALLG